MSWETWVLRDVSKVFLRKQMGSAQMPSCVVSHETVNTWERVQSSQPSLPRGLLFQVVSQKTGEPRGTVWGHWPGLGTQWEAQPESNCWWEDIRRNRGAKFKAIFTLLPELGGGTSAWALLKAVGGGREHHVRLRMWVLESDRCEPESWIHLSLSVWPQQNYSTLWALVSSSGRSNK
jgi:hypothetical protein